MDSIWSLQSQPFATSPLKEHLKVDVAIVGAGIAGITTAYLLQREGLTTAVIEAGLIGGGETGFSSAHLTAILDHRYQELQKYHGVENSRHIADSHMRAILKIEEIVLAEKLDCEFRRVTGYLFNPTVGGEPLNAELEALELAGFRNILALESVPTLPFYTGQCLRIPQQARVHILKYLNGLAQVYLSRGGQIYTNTPVRNVSSHQKVETALGYTVSASSVVMATHTPINNRFAVHTKQAAYRTYSIAAKIPKGTVGDCLYWDTLDPYHYLRIEPHSDAFDFLIIGGEDHKTGQDSRSASQRFNYLEAWARKRISTMKDVEFRWSGQILEPIDGLAYIGSNPTEKNVYVITGVSGNGLTHGTIGGMLVTDLIQGRHNPWAALYDPARKNPKAIAAFLKENLNAAFQYTDWMAPSEIGDVREIPLEQGAVVNSGNSKYATFKDEIGEIHQFSAACPHLGCVVAWNNAEKTWDCPCHGSRFTAMGRVINGPATADLKPRPVRPHPVKKPNWERSRYSQR